MCGILGAIPVIEADLFRKALQTLTHRGPDGEGYWSCDESVQLGHKRLAILDLSDSGHQPMHAYERFSIVFNGEIYNYKELRQKLEKMGHSFISNSDTEVLLKAYVEWRSECVNMLNGAFAFAIWDTQDGSLFMARDRMGQKPLFYSKYSNKFFFASEMKALYPLIGSVDFNKPLIDRVVFSEAEHKGQSPYFSYEHTKECLIEGIERFPSGHYAVYKNGKFNLNRYWYPLEEKIVVPNKYLDQVELFRELFEDSCRLRLQSDVPVATALSGGLDSSSVVAAVNNVLKAQNQGNSVKAFVACFPGTPVDERMYAEEVVNFLGIDAEYINVDPMNGVEDLPYLAYQFEELYLTNPIPFLQVYKTMKNQGIAVSLDGHGADELFAGYSEDMQAALTDVFPNPYKFQRLYKRIKMVRGDFSALDYKDIFNYYKYCYLNKYASAATKKKKGLQFSELKPGLDYLNSRLIDNMYEGGIPVFTRNFDRYSMINGVELRCPFLDYRLLKFAMSIPYSSKVARGLSKSIVRDAMKYSLPSSIVYRKAKKGFNPPVKEWITGQLKEYILDECNSAGFTSSQLQEGKELKKEILRYFDGNYGHDGGQYMLEKFYLRLWEKGLNAYSK